MTATDGERLMREIADRQAIRDLANRYAHLIWQKDAQGIAGLFAEDGEMLMDGDRPVRGRDAIVRTYSRVFAAAELLPFVHNNVVHVDGDTASGDCYLDLRAVMNGRSMTGAGHYHDEYVRTGAGWKFRSRKLTMRYLVPAAEDWSAGPPAT